MTQLPLDQAIPRFKGNEERVDKLVNGTDLEVWSTANGVVLPTFAKFLKDKEAEYDLAISGPVARAETAATSATASATAADASADQAAAILAEIQAGATNLVEKNFVGDGVQTAWTLDYAPKVDENLLVWVGGSIQDTADYSVTGTTLTITPAVPNLVKIRTLIITTATFNEITEAVSTAQTAATEADAARDEAVTSAAAAQGVGTAVAVWDSGTTWTMKDRATRTYCILDAPGNPDPTGNNESTASLKAMIAEGIRCELTKGDFVTLDSLLVTTPGQLIFGHGMGVGYGNHPSPLTNFRAMSRIIASGNAARKRVMTRRLMRSSAADPNDAPMNAVLDIEADGVHLRDFTVWLDVDYTNLSPTNLGANWDNGIFVGTRPLFQAWNVGVAGYFRRAGIYLDVSSALDWPELLDYDGNPLNEQNPSVFAGGDGTQLFNPFIYGPRIGLAVLGGLNDADAANYYDQLSGIARADVRGASGFSDFNVYGGRLYGPSHHSGYRLADPSVVPLTQAGLLAETDATIAAALMIDGRCGNGGSTTHGIGAIRGMNFFNTRIASFEKLRAYIRRADEVSFIGRSWSDTPLASPKNTAGVTVNSQDYVNSTYGHFTTHPTLTGQLHLDRATGGIAQSWVTNRNRLTVSSAGGSNQVTDLIVRKNANSSEIGDASKIILADDTAVAIPIPGANKSCVVTIMTANGADATAPRGTFLVRNGAAPVALNMISTANITFTTGALVDGSGTDGNVTISTHTDGMLYISNRAGASRTIGVQFSAPN